MKAEDQSQNDLLAGEMRAIDTTEAREQRVRKAYVVFDAPLREEFLQRMSDGETPLSICRDPRMPSYYTVRKHTRNDEEFKEAFDAAFETMLARMADETLDIADDGSNDWEERERKDGSTYIALNTEAVARSMLRVKARQWYLGIMSTKYRQANDVNVNVKGAIAVAHITDAERVSRLTALLGRVAARERRLEEDIAPALTQEGRDDPSAP